MIWAIFFGLCALLVTTFLAFIISMPSIISGTLSFSAYGAPSLLSGFSVGGAGIFKAIWDHLQTAPLWVMRFVWLLDQFVPIAHLLVVCGNVVTMNAWGGFVLRVIATIKRLIPS